MIADTGTTKVIDTSAFVAITFDEPDAGLVVARLGDAELVAPRLFEFELANVCLRKMRQNPAQREALLAAYRGMLVATDCLYGCPIGSLALELHEPDPAVRELLAANFDGWVTAVEGCLAEAAGMLPKGTDTTRLARFVLTTMEGGVMQSRTHRSLAAFDAGVDSLRDYFKRLRDAAIGETP